jgi:peptide-methionine (S)-S-oxide reductase
MISDTTVDIMLFARRKSEMPTPDTALKGRAEAIPTAKTHYLNKRPLKGPYPEGSERAMFGLGCFWGAERKFWQMGEGIHVTAVGYAGGLTPNPTYEEVCSGRTGHNEVVLVVYDPKRVTYAALLKAFWETHDPTQGMRQGNDVGSQYRSGIYVTSPEQRRAAEASKAAYQQVLSANGYGPITTEIVDAPEFYFAEDYHQQYLAKVPHGYCGLGGTGLSCSVDVAAKAQT